MNGNEALLLFQHTQAHGPAITPSTTLESGAPPPFPTLSPPPSSFDDHATPITNNPRPLENAPFPSPGREPLFSGRARPARQSIVQVSACGGPGPRGSLGSETLKEKGEERGGKKREGGKRRCHPGRRPPLSPPRAPLAASETGSSICFPIVPRPPPTRSEARGKIGDSPRSIDGDGDGDDATTPCCPGRHRSPAVWPPPQPQSQNSPAAAPRNERRLHRNERGLLRTPPE